MTQLKAGTPVGPVVPAAETPSPLTDGDFHEDSSLSPAKRQQMGHGVPPPAGWVSSSCRSWWPGELPLAGAGPAPGRPRTIVVVASATSNEPAPVLACLDRAMLRNAGHSSTEATAFVVNPDTGQARRVSLTPRRPDGEVDYGPGRSSELARRCGPWVEQLLPGPWPTASRSTSWP